AAVAGSRAGGDAGAAARSHEQVVPAGEVDRLDDIGNASAADDEGGPAVDIAVPDASRMLVPVVARTDQLAAQAALQGVDGGIGEPGARSGDHDVPPLCVALSHGRGGPKECRTPAVSRARKLERSVSCRA